MYRKLGTFLILFTLFSSQAAFGQKSDFGNWLIYFGNKQLNEQWNWHHEVQYRNYNFIGDLEQLLLRTGFGKNLTENNNNLLMGYGFIRSENYQTDGNKAIVNEHRIYQQFITKQQIGQVKVQHRYRFEQRWVEGDFKMRLRYFLGLNIPFKKTGINEGDFYGSIYNEIFLNTKGNVFDRNRLYGGIGYKLNSKLRFELGYMNQFLGSQSRDQLNMMTFFSF